MRRSSNNKFSLSETFNYFFFEIVDVINLNDDARLSYSSDLVFIS